jgi:hypothetical protein
LKSGLYPVKVSAIVFDGIPEGDVIEKKLYVEVSKNSHVNEVVVNVSIKLPKRHYYL